MAFQPFENTREQLDSDWYKTEEGHLQGIRRYVADFMARNNLVRKDYFGKLVLLDHFDLPPAPEERIEGYIAARRRLWERDPGAVIDNSIKTATDAHKQFGITGTVGGYDPVMVGAACHLLNYDHLRDGTAVVLDLAAQGQLRHPDIPILGIRTRNQSPVEIVSAASGFYGGDWHMFAPGREWQPYPPSA